jgi:hypothetical protein
LTVGYLLLSLTSIGLLSEGNPWAYSFEFIRSTLIFLASGAGGGRSSLQVTLLQIYALPSMLLWLFILAQRSVVQLKGHSGAKVL